MSRVQGVTSKHRLRITKRISSAMLEWRGRSPDSDKKLVGWYRRS